MNPKIEWSTSLQNLLGKMANRPKAMTTAIGQAIMMEGEETIADAKPLTPVLHGNLRSSGFVNLPKISGASISVTLGFGGVAGTGNQGGGTNEEDVGYAIPVHEDLTKKHPIGQALFLSTPLDTRKDSMPERLAGRIQDALPQ